MPLSVAQSVPHPCSLRIIWAIVPLPHDWAGTRLEFDPGTIVTYYVSIGGGITGLIAITGWDRRYPFPGGYRERFLSRVGVSAMKPERFRAV